LLSQLSTTQNNNKKTLIFLFSGEGNTTCITIYIALHLSEWVSVELYIKVTKPIL
jgi:hypothetical protein